jgi:hypothetical protein
MTPHPGTLIVTLLVVAGLLWANSAGALPLRAPAAASTSTGTIAYQGRLADADGNPITNTVNMIFRLYDVASGGVPLWEEQWTGSNGVQVSDGLFNVMLGSLTPIPQGVITGHDSLFLGITVGTDDEMTPRVQLGTVPFAVQALTVPDGSVTTAKIADGAVTTAKLNVDNGLRVWGTMDFTNQIPQFRVGDSATTMRINFGTGSDGVTKYSFIQSTEHGVSNDRALTLQNYGGNVGIGTTTPGEKLDIVGNVEVNGRIEIPTISNPTSDVPSPRIYYGDPGTGESGLVFRAWKMAFKAGVFNDTTTKMYIDATGNVGIGTTNPGARLDVIGDFRATGTKSAVVQAGEFGQRKLYAVESPDVRFSDEGLARLKDGIARVTLDPVFLETIEGDYLVHVTPYGNASLYVAEIGKDYFVVKARDGDPNVAFAWRLSAHRKGYGGVRLEQVEEP